MVTSGLARSPVGLAGSARLARFRFGLLFLGFRLDFAWISVGVGFGVIWLDSNLVCFGFGLILVGFNLILVGFGLIRQDFGLIRLDFCLIIALIAPRTS